MTTQSYPLVVCEIIEIPADLRMINFRCKLAWDIPSLKFPESSSSSCDEEFQCEEAEVECRDEIKACGNDLEDRNHMKTTETETVKEDDENKIAEISCDDPDDQISYSDIIFSIPIQKRSGDGEGLADSLANDEGEKEDEGPGLQSMLLNNFVTECENNSGKKSLSRRRLRKSLIDNNL